MTLRLRHIHCRLLPLRRSISVNEHQIEEAELGGSDAEYIIRDGGSLPQASQREVFANGYKRMETRVHWKT